MSPTECAPHTQWPKFWIVRRFCARPLRTQSGGCGRALWPLAAPSGLHTKHALCGCRPACQALAAPPSAQPNPCGATVSSTTPQNFSTGLRSGDFGGACHKRILARLYTAGKPREPYLFDPYLFDPCRHVLRAGAFYNATARAKKIEKGKSRSVTRIDSSHLLLAPP